MTYFFDEHPEFLETSDTASSKGRLNFRHLGIIQEHQEILRGARVLDIASHDGRWSYAALQAGASHVTGIEGRRHLVVNARKTMISKGVERERFRFVRGDAHDTLTAGVGSFDVVMLLGFLYHTLRYTELFAGIRATGARHVIVDTRVAPGDDCAVRLIRNTNRVESMAVKDRFSYKRRSLVGVPDYAAVVHMLKCYGYRVASRPDWSSIRAEHPELRAAREYDRGRRATLLAVSRRAEREAERGGPALLSSERPPAPDADSVDLDPERSQQATSSAPGRAARGPAVAVTVGR
jgi:protein-L-isoaspartate O-methyltransferase